MRKCLVLLSIAFCFLLFGCGAKTNGNADSNQDEMLENIENAIYEVLGEDCKKMSQHELVATITYGHEDGTGDGILYHMIKSTYFEADPTAVTGFNSDAVGVLFNPEFVDSSKEMKIQEWAGCLYRCNGKSFLCFTESPEMTYVLEYNAEEIPDSEILKMAESATPYESEK